MASPDSLTGEVAVAHALLDGAGPGLRVHTSAAADCFYCAEGIPAPRHLVVNPRWLDAEIRENSAAVD